MHETQQSGMYGNFRFGTRLGFKSGRVSIANSSDIAFEDLPLVSMSMTDIMLYPMAAAYAREHTNLACNMCVQYG